MDSLQAPIAPSPGFDTPVPAPVSPAPAQMPAPATAPAGPMTMAAGGTTGKPFGGFFVGITLVDVGMLMLVTTAMCYSIYASRQAVAYYSNLSNQTKQDIANLKSTVQNMQTPAAAPAPAIAASAFV